MKTKKTPFVPAGGVNSSLNAKPQEANSIINCRWDGDSGAWRADRSFQSWFNYPTGTNYEWNNTFDGDTSWLEENVRSMFFWKKPGSNTTYNFVEKSGALYLVAGNVGNGDTMPSGTIRSHWLKLVDWVENKDDEPQTQFIPFGRKLLILSANNKPLWFSDHNEWREFSFAMATPELEVIPPQPSYAQGEVLSTGTGKPTFSDSSVRGVGLTDDTKNYYYYAMAYSTEDGAISPLSAETSTSWLVDQTGTPKPKMGVVLTLPQCPEGASSRYIYRTKNIKTPNKAGAESFQLYFLHEIKDAATNFFIDIFPDTALISEADRFASSIISTTYRYGENWNNRMWLADKQRIIYSEAGIPEQFSAASFFDLSNTFGGDITGCKSFYNNLIVFRENAINVIKKDGEGFSVSVITNNIGTIATNAITYVPKLGLVFPNEDGLWALSGTLEGGGVIQVNKVSHAVNEELKTMNKSALRYTIAAYSPLEKEFWFHYPAYYSDVPNQGIVIHTDRNELTYSFRKAPNYIDNNLWTFSAMAVDNNGRFVLAGKHSWTDELNLDSRTNLFGWLQVWCASSYHGQSVTITGDDPFQLTFSTIMNSGAEWESSWISFDVGTARVFSVELDVIAYGDIGMSLDYQVDYAPTRNETTAQKQTEGKVLYTKGEPPVSVGPAGPDGITKNPWVINSSEVQGERKVRLRFDVNTGLINQFRFRVQGDVRVPFTIMGYRLNVNSEATPLINQSTNLQKGQSR